MKFLRGAVEDPRTVDTVVVILSAWLVLGAYILAYAYVQVPKHDPAGLRRRRPDHRHRIVVAPDSFPLRGIRDRFARWTRVEPRAARRRDGQLRRGLGTALLLNSAFKLRPGAITYVFGLNGVFVLITKGQLYLLPVPILTGLAADAWIAWLMGRLLRAGLPAAVVSPYLAFREEASATTEGWTFDPDSSGTPEALGRSPLAHLPGVSRGGSAAVELRAFLIDAIGEIAASTSPRDAESGHLLLDYYVKRVGSHEVIMERLHLSRPTYYRRLHRGFELVAGKLDELRLAQKT